MARNRSAPDPDTFLAELHAEFERLAADRAGDALSREVYELFQGYLDASDSERVAIDQRLEELRLQAALANNRPQR